MAKGCWTNFSNHTVCPCLFNITLLLIVDHWSEWFDESQCSCSKMMARVCSGIGCLGSDREVVSCEKETQPEESEPEEPETEEPETEEPEPEELKMGKLI